ncbi:MAG: zf-TFIIB domain-containing protein [Acidobacteriia bacterium]|nr:zf-TFIIB domain-containing protein [Terriglobia bacterium]
MTDTAIKRGVYHCPNCGAAAAPESVRCAYCRSTLATIVCPACYGAIFTGMKHCPWCGTEASAGTPAQPDVLKCPRCAADLMLINLGHEAVHECVSCGGLWLNKDTLQKLCDRQEEQEAVLGFEFKPRIEEGSAPGRNERLYIPCPACRKLMNRTNFGSCSGIIVDWCKTHGTWFDRDELRQIVLFIQGGGLKKARERDRARLEEEKLHLREQQRNLARITLLGQDSSLRLTTPAESDSLFQILSGIWRTLQS